MKPLLIVAMRWYAEQAGTKLLIQRTVGGGYWASFLPLESDGEYPQYDSLGWGEGRTMSQAVNAAFDDFVCNGH